VLGDVDGILVLPKAAVDEVIARAGVLASLADTERARQRRDRPGSRARAAPSDR
jgi:regulator of RNase E activity RraA